MKEYLVHLLKYNRGANAEVVKILEGMTEAERKADRRAFAKSLHGLFAHVAIGELYLQTQLGNASVPKEAFRHPYAEKALKFNEEDFPDFDDLVNAVRVLDDSFVAFAEGLAEKDLETKCTVQGFKGKLEVNVAWILIQVITHAVHHRGQISQVLDELGIPNDWSGIKPVY